MSEGTHGHGAPSRRTLIIAGAWSVPVIALASATPAFAASNDGSTCPKGPVTVLRGTSGISGTLLASQTGYTGWLPVGPSGNAKGSYVGDPTVAGFTSGADTATREQVVITASYSFTAVANASYAVAFSVVGGYGSYNNSTSYSERQSLDVDAIRGGSTTSLKKVSLVHTNTVRRTDADMKNGGYTLFAPSAGQQPYTATYLATAAGTVTIRYTFTMDRRRTTNLVNDDLWVTAPVVTLLSCAA